MSISTYMYSNPFLGVSMTACYLTRLNGMHVEYFPWYSIFHNSSLFHRHVFDTYGYRVASNRIQTNQDKDQLGAWSAHARDGRHGTSKKQTFITCESFLQPLPVGLCSHVFLANVTRAGARPSARRY